MGTALTIEPLDRCFGAWVRDVELRDLDDGRFAAVYEAWVEFGLLLFADQHLSPDEQNEVARRFGDLEFEASPISNIGRDGKVHSASDDDVVKSLRGNEGWHHDSTYMPVQAKGAVFSAEIIPSQGADTGWADMRHAYDALDSATKHQIADLTAHHSLYYSQGRAGYLPRPREDGSYAMYGYHDLDYPVRPLVKEHPDTGRKNLNIGRHAHDVIGMEPAASETLIDALNERAVADPDRVYHHRWTAGDTVVWDNRRLMHRGTPFDYREPRRMWHTRIAGDPATEGALNHR